MNSLQQEVSLVISSTATACPYWKILRARDASGQFRNLFHTSSGLWTISTVPETAPDIHQALLSVEVELHLDLAVDHTFCPDEKDLEENRDIDQGYYSLRLWLLSLSLMKCFPPPLKKC